jgi:hypothetical protein
MDLSGYHPVQIVVGLRKNKSNHQFHSGLEHTFLWVVEADNAHSIEALMGRTAGSTKYLQMVIDFNWCFLFQPPFSSSLFLSF